MLAAGNPLAETHEAEHGLEFARKVRFGLVIDLITALLRLICTLRGLTPTLGCFVALSQGDRSQDVYKTDKAPSSSFVRPAPLSPKRSKAAAQARGSNLGA